MDWREPRTPEKGGGGRRASAVCTTLRGLFLFDEFIREGIKVVLVGMHLV